VTHEDRVAAREPREAEHSRGEAEHFLRPRSSKEKAVEAAVAPVVILGDVLAHDETFRDHAREVARDTTQADVVAARYAHSGAGRRAIAVMLMEASRCCTAPVGVIATRLMNMSRNNGVFVEAPRDATEATNALQKRARDQWIRGAELLVRRGARRCLNCGAHRVRGYCAAHKLEYGEPERDEYAMRATLRAVAEQLAIASDGPQSRRARRSKP
jgi:hypothetical protein